MKFRKVIFILLVIIYINLTLTTFFYASYKLKRESFISSKAHYIDGVKFSDKSKSINIAYNVTKGVDLSFTARVSEEDIQLMQEQIYQILGNEMDNYAIYVKDLNSTAYWEHNSTQAFYPASIYKVPLAIITLKDIDDGKFTLTDNFLVTPADKPYTFDRLAQIPGSYNMSVSELLRYMIVYSDNTAMITLENRNGGVYALQTRMQQELDITGITRVPHITNAASIAKFYQGIYNQEYLTKENNDYLLDLLKNTAATFDDRIVSGVPAEVEVAHKIGNLNGVYQDAGIVYAEHEYVIVILNKNTLTTTASSKISQISRIVYDVFGKD
ncbi:serine hydrolase [Candidatus Dojkabacteria bacterium]|uniref:Serine hydrolase n=1 Tax=Candidatus Dojkabacteria bacterium TaxID=2099670 RepID=A0A955L5J0_9BACT|nr:serine hydrolase [Candidatus Dojkabacteria bacterium]